MPRPDNSRPFDQRSHPERVIRWLILLIVLGGIAVGALMHYGIIKKPNSRGGQIFSTPVPLPSSH